MNAVSVENAAIIAIVIAAGSEILAITPLKSNSWLQLLFQVARLMFSKQRR